MDQLLAAKAANTALKAAAQRVMSGTLTSIPRWCITARPYLAAIRDNDYGMEDPVMCVLYALNNMVSWKGETAREVKQMLNEAIEDDLQR